MDLWLKRRVSRGPERPNREEDLNFRVLPPPQPGVGIERRVALACGQPVDDLCGAGETPGDTISWGRQSAARWPGRKLYGRFLIALLLRISMYLYDLYELKI
jgi:hypothetical protein